MKTLLIVHFKTLNCIKMLNENCYTVQCLKLNDEPKERTGSVNNFERYELFSKINVFSQL